MNQEIADKHFARLADALKIYLLPTEAGPYRSAEASEFMCMEIQKDGTVQFKHYDTRNYLLLLPDGKIEIPTGEMFCRGFF